MKKLSVILISIVLFSCTYKKHSYSVTTDSNDSVSVTQSINTLDTSSLKTGKPHYKAYSRKTNYYVNGVLVKHKEQHYPDSAKSTQITENISGDMSRVTIQNTAFFDHDARLRKSAVSMLKDQSDIQHVAFFDQSVDVRKLAVTMIDNDASLQHVAYFDKDVQVRKLAVSMMKEQAGIEHVAYFDRDVSVRKLAVSKITETAALEHVIAFDKDTDVRKLALNQLNKNR